MMSDIYTEYMNDFDYMISGLYGLYYIVYIVIFWTTSLAFEVGYGKIPLIWHMIWPISVVRRIAPKMNPTILLFTIL